MIAADPAGAERRREEAERQARVVLYPEAEGTASLAGYSLPGVRVAAAMARISALAQALKASGAGGIDLLRAQVFLGLLLGTLPYIPPPDGHPPDPDPPGDSSPCDSPPDEEPPARGRAPAWCPGRDDDPGHRDPGHRSDQGDQRHGPGQRGDRGEQGARPPPTWPEVPPLLRPGPAAMDHLAIERGRRHDEVTPEFDITCRDRGASGDSADMLVSLKRGNLEAWTR